MDSKELVDIGLTSTQARVYLALIESPQQTGGELAKKISLDRSFVYGILDGLLLKGLAHYMTKDNKRFFSASNPDNLLKEIEDKRTKTIALVKKLKTIQVPDKGEHSVRVYEGKSGLKAYIAEFLEAKNYVTFGGGDTLKVLDILKYDYPHYVKKLTEKKVKGRLITSQKNKDVMTKVHGTSVEIKTMRGLKYTAGITVTGTKIAFYSGSEKPQIVILENADIAKTMKVYFDQIWTKTDT